MKLVPHRIRRQRWEVRAGSAATAFAIRQQLRDQWAELILPAFDQAFDETASGDRTIRIPKLELRLKISSVEQLHELLPGLIRQQLREQLSDLQLESARSDAAWKETLPEQNRFEYLLHYLQTGSLPWEATGEPTAEPIAELQNICHQQWPEIKQLLQREPDRPAAFYFRLFQLAADQAGDLTPTLLAFISQPWQPSVLELLVALEKSGEHYFGRHYQLELLTRILAEALALRHQTLPPDIRTLAARVLPLHQDSAWNEFVTTLSSPARLILSPQAESQNDHAAKTSSSSETKPDSIRGNDHSSPTTPSATAENAAKMDAPASASKLVRTSVQTNTSSAEFPLMVPHVGLILLHPFLPRFLENCGIKETTAAELSPFALPRAAALLHFLATGSSELYEYDLGFIKILLGLTPETPLGVANGLLEAKDRQEAESLLQSVIAHWAALKNTSNGGLRSSFINRTGLVRENADGWRLQVERKSFDLLLDQLPWSFSLARLPWLAKPIFTEW